MKARGGLVAYLGVVLGSLGYGLVAVGVLMALYPVLVTGAAAVPVSSTGVLTTLDRLVHAVTVSAGIPTLDTGLSPSSARLAGAATIALGWMIVLASRLSVIPRCARRWSGLPGETSR
jgi:hypothetical protein